eukprot:jgi/Botrbrau1/3368/Bobra.0337s0009.1
MPDLYEILGVTSEASIDDIKQGFRQKALECHPDISDSSLSSREFRKLVEAYEVLRNPQKRKEYDRLRQRLGQEPFPHARGRNWRRPSDESLDEFYKQWMARHGFGEAKERAKAKRERDNIFRARTAWEEEKASATFTKARAERLRQRTQEARVKRQAAMLRAFWQTHHGVTRQDAAALLSFMVATVGVWHLWPSSAVVDAPEADT